MKLLVGLMLSLFAVTSFARTTVVECESPVGVPGVRSGDLIFKFKFSKQNETQVSMYLRSTQNEESLTSEDLAIDEGTVVKVDLKRIVGHSAEFVFENSWLGGNRGNTSEVQAVVFEKKDNAHITFISCHLAK